jgi:WD40 repeat protein
LSFGADGRKIAVALQRERGDRCVEVCDAATGAVDLLVEEVHALPAVTSDGSRLATAHAPDVVKIWDIASGRQIATLRGRAESSDIAAIAFSDDGRRLATVGLKAGSVQTVAIYDTDTAKELMRFQPSVDCGAIAFTPDGKRLATGGDAGVVTLWDATTGQEVLVLRAHNGAVGQVKFSPNGRFLATSGKFDGVVKLWEAP